MLTHTLNVDEGEIMLLMQLLNKHFVEIQRGQMAEGKEPSTPFEAELMQKLASTRDAGIVAARAAGTL